MKTEVKIKEIERWESAEVKRSANEAHRKIEGNLKISEATIKRYLNPPSDTPYPLEYAYHLLGDVNGKTVLDYGCGTGDNSVVIASHGAKVVGLDISPELIALAEKRLAMHDAKTAEFRVGSAYEVPLEDESVDVVFGMAILHHLDLRLSSREVFRVLKKGGRAIFSEPVRNSKLMWFLRGLVPYQPADISPFERPLIDEQLETYAEEFASFKIRAFSLPFVNVTEILRLPESFQRSAVEFDRKLLNKKSFLDYYASIRVIEITK